MAVAAFTNIGLHHVGYLVPDIPVAAAHFTGALGYRVESDVIEDPIQTARVQFFRTPGGNSWLELISPLGKESKLTAALAKGGGLNHLCYEVSDLPLACQHFRENQCMLLSPPALAQAFPGRRIAWFMDNRRFLFELVEKGSPPLSLEAILQSKS
jgi:methylmalonyl-CoA/ethylmalonyl-CoA epimerase